MKYFIGFLFFVFCCSASIFSQRESKTIDSYSKKGTDTSMEQEAAFVIKKFGFETSKLSFYDFDVFNDLNSTYSSFSKTSLVSLVWRTNDNVYWLLAEVRTVSNNCNSNWVFKDQSQSLARYFEIGTSMRMSCSDVKDFWMRHGTGIRSGKSYPRN